VVSSGIETTVLSLGDVTSNDLLDGLAEGGCFSIPPIQRQYQWGPGEADKDTKNRSAREFVKDTIMFHRLSSSSADPYYIGTMIVYKEKKNPDGQYELMDGQQRWTTITSLMGVIHHLLDQDQTGAKWTREKNEIKKKFLQNEQGGAMLSSDREFDDYVVKKITRFDGHIDISELDPKDMPGAVASKIPKQQYNTELGTFQGTNLFCVSSYFLIKLKEEFGINGPLDSRDRLVAYYRCLRSQLFLNLTMAPSSRVAYKMFVTANARGTALTNFDIFRGLVIARELEGGWGKSKHYKDAFDNATTQLQQYLALFKEADAAKKTDDIMSQATSIIVGKGTDSSSVMAVLEKLIDDSKDHDSLDALCSFVFSYLNYTLLLAEGKVTLPGRRAHLRLVYAGFSQHTPLYIAAMMNWTGVRPGSGKHFHTDEIHHLLRIVECIIFRIWLNNGEAREATLLMWNLGYKVAKDVYFSKKEERKVVLKSVAEKFSKYKSNPDNLAGVKLREWNWASTKAGNYPLTSVMYALEETSACPIRKGKGAGSVWKMTPLMPRSDEDWWNRRHWDYGPEMGPNPQPRSKTIGNMFALKPTRGDINHFPWLVHMRVQSFRGAMAGLSVTNADIQGSNAWDHDHIDSRNDRLIELLEKRFPHPCWLPKIDSNHYSSN